MAGRLTRGMIRTKLAILVTCAIVLMLVAVSVICLVSFHNEQKRVAYEAQETKMRVFRNLIEHKGEGVSIRDGKLVIGNYVINGNHEVPDEVRKLCGGTAAVFMGDVAVSTSIMRGDGTRAVGEKLPGVAYDTVFGRKKPYRGEIDILGEPYLLAYDPIRDRSGNIIGVLCTGIKKSERFDTFNSLMTNLFAISLAFAAGICILLHFMIGRMVTKPLSALVHGIRDTECNLSARFDVSRRDEIGELARWFNRFISNMEKIIAEVKIIAGDVDNATNEVAAEAQGLSQATQETAFAMEQVTATIEEITASIKNNALNAEKGREKAKSMVRMANTSGESSQELMQAMDEISSASKKVGDIISTVNEVAFQTNLLALNAAVEAARAGEHGKGFAVVAEEVRALAQRSARAAGEIKTLIQDTVRKVQAGDEIAKKSVQYLAQIIECISEVSQTMEEVASSSTRQSAGVDEVNRALAQIDSTTQRNAATFEDLADTSDNLSDDARELADMVRQFKVSEDSRKQVAGKRQAAGVKRKVTESRPEAIDLDMSEGFQEF